MSEFGTAPSSSKQPPSYTRREGHVAQSEWHYASNNRKLAAKVIGSGSSQHPVYMPDLFDTFQGEVTVHLPQSEAISAVRVRLKCCLLTSARKCRLSCPARSQGHRAHPEMHTPGQKGPRQTSQEVILVDETQVREALSAAQFLAHLRPTDPMASSFKRDSCGGPPPLSLCCSLPHRRSPRGQHLFSSALLSHWRPDQIV